MDGGERILRSLRESLATSLPPVHFPLAQPEAAVAGAAYASADLSSQPPHRSDDGPSALQRYAFFARPGVGLVAALLLFGGVGLAGALQNGGYDALIRREGQPWDIAARAFGFDISAITITGQSRLTENELLDAAGVTPRQSLLFLDAGAVRERLLAIPLVKTARVMKLYPNRLVVAIEERRPQALWQRDGRILVVSDDGVAIDELRDERYLGLPFVVGDGAQKRLPEFLAIREGMGDLAQRVKAGVLVAGRRWDIEMTNGVIVKLPEADPGRAIGVLIRLQREARILDKDVMAIDLRADNRVTVRLTEEAAAAREAALPHKTKKAGG